MNVLFVLYQKRCDDSVWHALNLAKTLFVAGVDTRVAISADAYEVAEYITAAKLPIERALANSNNFFARFYQNDTFQALQSRFPPDLLVCYGPLPRGFKHLRQCKPIGIATALEQPTFSWAKQFPRLIATSQAVKNALASFAPRKPIYTIYGGLDEPKEEELSARRMAIRKELGIADTNVLIGILGAITPSSGHASLMQALADDYHPNLKLLAFTDTADDLERFHQLSRKHNIASVAFSKIREANDTAALGALDIGVIADTEANGVARRAIELLSAGVATIASCVSADSELVCAQNRYDPRIAKVLLNTIIEHASNERTMNRAQLLTAWKEAIDGL
jgi:hypothetical protein